MTDQLLPNDVDPQETQEWLEAIESVIKIEGSERAHFLIEQLIDKVQLTGAATTLNTPYKNTIPANQEPSYPGDLELERQINGLIRWNALTTVLRAGKKAPELGGHLASFASSATLYNVGFNHFFHTESKEHGGDLVFIQGHCSPGIYARSFLEGRFSEKQMDNFRQEVEKDGISSYPHPWLMPEYWQFPTVSMGLGPLQAIYQARMLKYLENRGLQETEGRHVWCFCGDGEMDEPESLGNISLAANENLDNLTFIINCNLLRLDGPVRGNSKIIQEFERIFHGAGWNVIKVIWGSEWDALFAKDRSGLLLKRMEEYVDGEYQNLQANDGAFAREHFFNKYPELNELVKDLTDDEIWHLKYGGLDAQKVFAAFDAAVKHKGQPTVILAKTVKGFGMGEAGEAQNITHQQKKMGVEQLKMFRDRFKLPVTDDQLEKHEYYRPAKNSKELQYLKNCRDKLGGLFPHRRAQSTALQTPELDTFGAQMKGTGDREISTTMAFVRVLNVLLKDKNIGKNIVPIVPDEARTFGMEGMFRQLGIYSPIGQLYTPQDSKQVMYYREAKDGQYIQQGINEPGAFAMWMAAATSYSNNNLPMIPFYVYYSMFGFQRIHDLAWAAGDMQARGFLIGGLSGRTTLAGEGLQHQDGHSHVLAGTIPNCISYDTTYSYEIAVIIQDGLRRMYQQQENVFYYLTVGNENYVHVDMPKGSEEGILKGLYLFQEKKKAQVQLISSGTLVREAVAAAEILEKDYKIAANIWSATSMNELHREAMSIARENLLNPDKKPKKAYVTTCLEKHNGPVVAVTDYIKNYADQIRAFIPTSYTVLGTDGFGRSDTRAELRHYFEVDRYYIAYAALKSLHDEGKFSLDQLKAAMKKLKINPKKPEPIKH